MSDRNDPHATTEDSESRVIVIGWQLVVLPIVLIGVIGAGFVLGRQVAARRTPPTPIPVAMPTAGPIVVSPQDLGGITGSQSLTSRYDPTVVYDLPRLPHPLLGQPAPDFEMTVLSTGEAAKLSDYLGKPVVLDFWATWCAPCRYEMPWLQELSLKHAEDGLTVLGFNVGEKVAPSMAEQVIRSYVDSMGLTFPILVGDQSLPVQQTYQVMGYPTLFLIDAEGKVVDFHQGMFPNQVTLESRVAAVLPEGAAAQ